MYIFLKLFEYQSVRDWMAAETLSLHSVFAMKKFLYSPMGFVLQPRALIDLCVLSSSLYQVLIWNRAIDTVFLWFDLLALSWPVQIKVIVTVFCL